MNVHNTLKRAAKSVGRSPAYLAACVAVLGISIGTLLVVTSLADQLILRIGGVNSSRIVFVSSSAPGGVMGYLDFLEIRNRTHTIDLPFAFSKPREIAVVANNRMRMGYCSAVSGEYFTALGVRPSEGRVFTREDDAVGAEAGAIISEKLASTLGIGTGSEIRINGKSFRIFGLVKDDFRGLMPTNACDVWIPLSTATLFVPRSAFEGRGLEWLNVAGRGSMSRTMDEVRGEIRSLGQSLERDFPATNRGKMLTAVSSVQFRLSHLSEIKPILLLNAVAWVLFSLALTNVLALSLLRVIGKAHESSIMAALGAQRRDILAWILSELLVVLAASVVLGLGVAWLLFSFLRKHETVLSWLNGISIGFHPLPLVAVVFAATAGTAAVAFFTLRYVRSDALSTMIKQSAGAARLPIAFPIIFSAQVAIGCFLLFSSLSMTAGIRRAFTTHSAFDNSSILAVKIDLRIAGKPGSREGIAYIKSLMQAIAASSEIERVAGTDALPFASMGWADLVIRSRDANSEKLSIGWSVITPGYFQVLSVGFLAGRDFAEDDVATGRRVAIINRMAAFRYFANDTAIGQAIQLWEGGPWYTVVGVVGDVPTHPSLPGEPIVYTPYGQTNKSTLTLVAKVRGSSSAGVAAIRDAVRKSWPYENVPLIRSLHEQLDAALTSTRIAADVVGYVSALGVGVLAVGMYLISAYVANQRRREVAIRLALGAKAADVWTQHLARQWKPIAVGGTIGISLGYWSLPLFTYLGSPGGIASPGLVIATGIGIGVVTLVGLSLPLRRALRVDLRTLLVDSR